MIKGPIIAHLVKVAELETLINISGLRESKLQTDQYIPGVTNRLASITQQVYSLGVVCWLQ